MVTAGRAAALVTGGRAAALVTLAEDCDAATG
jgi:hypothetical protein